MMADKRPDYTGLLIDGRLPENPPSFTVKEGERVRFRFTNTSSATAFELKVADHPLNGVTHANGRLVEPVTINSIIFGSGERSDIVNTENPGMWELRATALDDNEPPATAIPSYEESSEPQSLTAPS